MSDTCPTCGSDDPYQPFYQFHNTGKSYKKPPLYYDPRRRIRDTLDKKCPDPFHDTPAPDREAVLRDLDRLTNATSSLYQAKPYMNLHAELTRLWAIEEAARVMDAELRFDPTWQPHVTLRAALAK